MDYYFKDLTKIHNKVSEYWKDLSTFEALQIAVELQKIMQQDYINSKPLPRITFNEKSDFFAEI